MAYGWGGGKMKVCGDCSGTGRVQVKEKDPKTNEEVWVSKQCGNCSGTGEVKG